MKTIDLKQGELKVSLHDPDPLAGFYRGTRFDRAGVFDAIVWKGIWLADRWFERYDPYLHDVVGGPAEEFSAIGYDEAARGDMFLKIGVGLLVKPTAKPYDRFRLYTVADRGRRETVRSEDAVTFIHEVGPVRYEKEIRLEGGCGLSIAHRLENTGFKVLSGDVYNHNFFTLGLLRTGPTREVEFAFTPAGNWRARYDQVALTGNGIRFYRDLRRGESVWMGDLHADGAAETPYDMTLRERSTGCAVRITGDRPLIRTVFWANHRIACVEPYNAFSVAPGKTAEWSVHYDFTNE